MWQACLAIGLAVQVALVEAASTTTSTTNKPSVTSTVGHAVHTINVGGGGFHQFQPNSTIANKGDIIVFQFYPQNHSVVQAPKGYPCVPYDTMNPGKPSFFSGFQPVPNTENLRTWNLTINDTNPAYFYCSAPGSCKVYGMVGVINPENSSSVELQSSLAMRSDYVLQPGEPIPPEQVSQSMATAIATQTLPVPSTSISSTAPAVSTSAAVSTSTHKSLTGGTIAGIAIGGAAALLLLGALVWYVSRSRTLKQTLDKQRCDSDAPDMKQNFGPASPFLSQEDYERSRWSTNLPPYARSPPPHMMKMGVVHDVRSVSPVNRAPYAQGLAYIDNGRVHSPQSIHRRPTPVTSELGGEPPVHEIG